MGDHADDRRIGRPDRFQPDADLADREHPPKRFKGRYIHYGIREHAMAAVMNGLSLHGGFIPYGGTFLVFSDYARGGMRLSALMEQG
jgi:transketolase